MQDVSLCPECKVPEVFTSNHIWLNNGEIVHANNPSGRQAFMECENLDPLFANIGAIIGMPIERMVINITSRAVKAYLSRLMPEDIKSLLLSMKPGDAALREQCRQVIDALTEANTTLAAIMGYGKYENKSYRYERDDGDYSNVWVTEPYSIPFVVGSHIGHNATIIGGENEVEYKEISPGVFELTAHWAKVSSQALKERLQIREYTHRGGDIELERCATCGGPAALSGYKWYLDRGVIQDGLTGKRMAMLGPSLLDPIFDELEAELGETIPHAIVEAQRRFVRTGFFSIKQIGDKEAMRDHLALRGLGNLREIEMSGKGARARVDNTVIHLFAVGLVQGLFEMAFDVDSHVEWDLSEEGNLAVEVNPKR